MKQETPNTQPEEIQKEKTRGLFKSKGIIEYFRELSIVIIGVLITFLITGFINDYNRQKEISGMMELVREELSENLETLEWLQVRWNGEMDAWKLLLDNIDNPEQIPEETLEEYDYTIGAPYQYDFKEYSYDLLKLSTLMQYVKEKELLRRLSKSYGKFAYVDQQLRTYSQQKTEVILPMVENMDIRESELWVANTRYRFQLAVQDKGFKRFLPISSTILQDGTIESLIENVIELMREMQEIGY